MLGMRQIASLLLLVFWSGCSTELETEPTSAQHARVEMVVDVDGMVCDACSKAVVDANKCPFVFSNAFPDHFCSLPQTSL